MHCGFTSALTPRLFDLQAGYVDVIRCLSKHALDSAYLESSDSSRCVRGEVHIWVARKERPFF